MRFPRIVRRSFTSAAALALGLLALPATAQVQFAESLKSHFPVPRLESAGVSAADIDGDNDLDLFFPGFGSFAGVPGWLLRNDGGHRFTDISATHWPRTPFNHYSADFGDVDGDGDLDAAVADTVQDRLYLNDGTGKFTDATFGRMPVDILDTRRVLLVDLDGDLDLDMVRANYGPETVYQNDGTGRFTDVSGTSVPGNVQEGAWDIDAGDVDGDGDLDLVFASQTYHRLWLNLGNGVFADATGTRLPITNANGAGVSFADIEADGDLDLVCSNYLNAPTLYANNGSGVFTNVTAGRMPSFAEQVWELDVGDVDGDLDVDVVFAIYPQSRLCLNNGAGVFTDAPAGQLPVFRRGTYQVELADLDNDGDLDLAEGNVGHAGLLYNDGAGTFLDATPVRMESTTDGTYGLALGDVDGDGDLDAVCANGDLGGFNASSRLLLNDSHGFLRDAPSGAFPVDGDDTRAVALGDVNADGRPDVVLGNSKTPPRLYFNTPSGVFVDASGGLSAPANDTRAVALGDVDGDGDRDVVLGNLGAACELHRNNGSGTFTLASGALPAGVYETRALALVDVDLDNDLDLVLGNGLAAYQQNRLYLNNGTGQFSDATATHGVSEAVPTSSIAVGDVDQDGDPDLLFGNDTPIFGTPNSLWLNDGTGHFSNGSARLPYALHRTFALALGDLDNDGDLDLATGDYHHWNKLYLNDGTGNFVDATLARMPGIFEDTVALALGDLDGDGDVDLVNASNGWVRFDNVLYPNHLRQVWAPRLARLGETFAFDVFSQAGYATAPQSALVLAGTTPAQLALPPYGTLRISPVGMLVLPLLPLSAPSGKGTAAVPLPNAPALVGIDVLWQALVLPTPDPANARLTNAIVERLVAF